MHSDPFSQLSLDELANIALGRDSASAESTEDVGTPFFPPLEPGPVPLSYAQERFWIMDRLSRRNPFFNIQVGVSISGELNRQALRDAWLAVIERHDPLRSVFVLQGERPETRYLDTKCYALELRDAPELSGDFWTAPPGFLHELLYTGFSLEEGPLIRGVLLAHSRQTHSLLLAVHHSVFDGWSTRIFLSDLFAVYGARLRGDAFCPELLHISYAQYAQWQRNMLASPEMEGESTWWKNTLEGMPDLDLPTDFPRPPVQNFAGGATDFHLEQGQGEALVRISREAEVTPYIGWLCLYSLALASLSGQSDFGVGCTASVRAHPALEPLIGCFLNNLTLRIKLQPDKKFKDFIRELGREFLRVMDHAELPFQHVAGVMGSSLDLGKHPLFQAALTFQNTPMPEENVEGLTLRPMNLPVLSTHLDLELIVWPQEESIRGTVIYATDLFKPESIESFCESLKRLTSIVTTTPEMSLRRILALESEAKAKEASSLSVSFGGENPFAFSTPWELFSALLAREPERDCLVIDDEAGSECFSVGEFARQVEKMARALKVMGFGPGMVAAVALPQGYAQLAAMLAVWKLGGAWTPVDPDYPCTRVYHVLQGSGASYLLSTPGWLAGLSLPPELAYLTPVYVPEVTDNPEGEVQRGQVFQSFPENDLPEKEILTQEHKVVSSDIACVLYTSGSTGRPKSIELSFGAVCHRWKWMWEAFPWRDDDCVCQKTSPLFVDFLWEAFGAILAGVKLLVPSRKIGGDVQSLLKKMEHHRVTHIVLVPSLLRTMKKLAGGFQGRLQSLRLMVSSGETFPLELADELIRAVPGLRILNLYGSTEVMDVTIQQADKDNIKELLALGEFPLGTALPGGSAAVLNDFDLPVPRGHKGLIHVSGSSLAMRYRSGGEQEAFVELDGVLPGGKRSRFFRMGDEGWIDPEGRLRYLGRKDHQVKIRGVRIELEDVRTALLAQENVRDVVVSARPDPLRNLRLAAHVIFKEERPEALATLRAFLLGRLPAVMIPDVIIPVAAWPRTPSGKIDKQKLPCPEGDGTVASTAPAPEAADTLQTLAELWRTVLGVSAPDYQTTFFEAGGNSLLLTILHDQIQKRFGREFPLTELFDNPTIESQTRLMNEIAQDRAGPAPVKSRAEIRRSLRGRVQSAG